MASADGVRPSMGDAQDHASDGTFCILFDGEAVSTHEGQSVAAALLAAGYRTLRHSARRGEPRGMFCGMGVCFDCVMRIDGRAGVRACQTLVANGMHVQRQ